MPLAIMDTDYEKARWVLSHWRFDLVQGVAEAIARERQEAERKRAKLASKDAEIERLKAALRDAHGLIDNDLLIPWIAAHKLDDVLGIEFQLPEGD